MRIDCKVMHTVNTVIVSLVICFLLLAAGCRNSDKPEITGFSPESGEIGDSVVITGKNFSTTPSNNTVRFNGTTALVTQADETQITAAVPEGATTGKISVEVDGNTATSSSDFTVISSSEITSPVFGGQYEDDDDNTLPCYWIGDERVDLPIGTKTYGWALSPTVIVGTTIYVAGEYYSDSSDAYIPCYWAGSTRHDLPVPDEATSFQITGIAVSNGVVYTVGHYDYQYSPDRHVTVPCFWTNTGQPQLLTDPAVTGRAYAYAVTVSGGTVYIAGRYLDSDDDPATPPYRACYWQGSTLVNLPTPAIASNIYPSAITVSEGTVYTSGTYYYYDDVLTSKACYWIDDDDPILLDSPDGAISQGSRTSSIAVSGGDVYVGGEHWHDAIDRVCYWKNGVLTTLASPAGSVDQYSSAMVILDDIVYIGGGYNYLHDFNYYWMPCYWTDAGITNLDDIGNEAYINSSMWWWD